MRAGSLLFVYYRDYLWIIYILFVYRNSPKIFFLLFILFPIIYSKHKIINIIIIIYLKKIYI